MRQALARIAAGSPRVVVWVDSRMRAEHFRGVIVKPNREEAEAASVRALGRIDYPELRRLMDARLLVITHGGRWRAGGRRQGSASCPPAAWRIPWTSAAPATASPPARPWRCRVTGDPVAAARFGNLVASITIMKKGTGTASPGELLAAS